MADKLVHPALLEYARRDVELVDVGKQGPCEEAGAKGWGATQGAQAAPRPTGTTMQQAINRRMVEEAQDGKKVVRLKGGDPFIFGRGGEELLEAAAHGFTVDVIPGISAGMAAASYHGHTVDPSTHESIGPFLTGHRV